MFPLLAGGVLIFLVGSVMVLAVAFGASTLWGVLCLLLPPLQWLFVLLNWGKTWDGLMLQVFGLALALAFFAQADAGYSVVAVQDGWQQFQRQHLPAGSRSPDSAVLTDGQPVQAVTADPAIDSGVIHSVEGDTAPATVTVQAAPSKAVDDKPIYKCTDPQGKETWSAKPCQGSAAR